MSRKIKGEWPYHEDPHGNWIACSSNPCKLHSGGDIMATSPEDAFAKADRLAHPNGPGGYTGTAVFTGYFGPGSDLEERSGNARPLRERGGQSYRMDEGMTKAYELAKAHREKVRKVEEAMKEFCAEPADPPENLSRRFETSLDVGGKYDETKDMDQKDVAKLIRKDMNLLRKAGGLPKGWKVSVKVNRYAGANGFNVTIKRPEGSAPMYRSIRPTDIYDPHNEGEMKKEARDMLEEDTGKRGCSYPEAVEYCRQHPEHEVRTDDADDAYKYVQRIADQYSMTGSSERSMYSRSHHASYVHMSDDERNVQYSNISDLVSDP